MMFFCLSAVCSFVLTCFKLSKLTHSERDHSLDYLESFLENGAGTVPPIRTAVGVM